MYSRIGSIVLHLLMYVDDLLKRWYNDIYQYTYVLYNG